MWRDRITDRQTDTLLAILRTPTEINNNTTRVAVPHAVKWRIFSNKWTVLINDQQISTTVNCCCCNRTLRVQASLVSSSLTERRIVLTHIYPALELPSSTLMVQRCVSCYSLPWVICRPLSLWSQVWHNNGNLFTIIQRFPVVTHAYSSEAVLFKRRLAFLRSVRTVLWLSGSNKAPTPEFIEKELLLTKR